jgi:hypothetical protein
MSPPALGAKPNQADLIFPILQTLFDPPQYHFGICDRLADRHPHFSNIIHPGRHQRRLPRLGPCVGAWGQFCLRAETSIRLRLRSYGADRSLKM